jgi:SAM-dependent methyltransferase
VVGHPTRASLGRRPTYGDEVTTRGLLFGNVADAYERFRRDYPAEVADLITAYALPPLRDAVEIGAGTGKATRLIAARGIHVTACEPHPEMARVLRAMTVGLDVTIVEQTFEEFTAANSFDLLYAAASWHWTNAETRWRHTAEMVRPGGTVAFFSAGRRLSDPDLHAAVEEVRRTKIADEDARARPPSPEDGLRWPGDDLQDHPQFTDVEQHEITRLLTVPADDFVGDLSTLSAYLQLSEPVRADLLLRIRAVLPETVQVDSGVTLHLARVVAAMDRAG